MDARLVLEASVRVAAAHLEDGVLEAAHLRGRRGQDLAPQAAALRVVPVHLQELSCPQRRLLPTGPGADLEDDVLPVVRILRDEELLELRAERDGEVPRATGLLEQ